MPTVADLGSPQNLSALLAALTSKSSQDRSRAIARWRSYMAEARAGLDRQRATFDQIYREQEQGDAAPDEIRDLAAATRSEMHESRERIGPAVEILNAALREHANDAELSQILRQALEVVPGVLVLFHDLHQSLLELAAKRETGPDQVLRARPVTGEIDHEALTREIIARYPKILAALAK
jgi:hypothetical protein